MPIRTIAGTDAQYFLISLDKDGVERPEADGSKLSDTIRRIVADPTQAVTDVFFASHGWKGDVPAAIEQYDLWVGEMARSPDRAAAKVWRPDFRSIVVGLHWPSLPFGDEQLPAEGGLLSANDDASLDSQVEQYAASIADTPTARAAIRTIVAAARRDDGGGEQLPPDVRKAYQRLYVEAMLEDSAGDPGAPPGADHQDWNPDAIYREARNAAAKASGAAAPGLLGGGVMDTLKDWATAPLKQLSFWKMKDRARRIGESGGHKLLRDLQGAGRPSTRFHLMGHSFGCIVVSAMVAGAPGGQPLDRPVDSLFLVQGALSLWSFCPDIPYARNTPGYFNRIVKNGLVRGPIVTTRSSHDTAVGSLYPHAADAADQLVLGVEYPKYGGVGTFGAQGLGSTAEDLEMQAATRAYTFTPGRVYNLEASKTIKSGGGFSGAHSDIAHPEVAHAMWATVLAAK